MTIALFVFAAIALSAGSLGWGLWYGERRRSETLENLLRSGTPEKPKASVRPAPADTEADLAGGQTIPESMIQAVADGILAKAQAEKLSITPAQARAEAELLLNDQGNATSHLSSGGV